MQRGDRISDLNGWLKHLHSKTGIAFLHYFARAPEIEREMRIAGEELKAPKDLTEAKKMAARCSYNRASENRELAELCRAYNVPADGDECSFNKCLDYLNSLPRWPMKDSDNLPHPVVVGSGEADGYCLVKLPTDDLRALILGRITACCQNIGGQSEQCVKDAITLPNNGLYVLLKRKDKAAYDSGPYIGNKINDADFEIVGQSYGWLGATGKLSATGNIITKAAVLDSFEFSNGRVTTSVVRAILTQFAEKVFTEDPSIKRVTIGTGGGTPRDIGFNIAPIPEKMRSGYQYVDSKVQLIIARQPKIPEDEFNRIMTKLNIEGEFKVVLGYLSDHLTDTRDFEEDLTQLLGEYPELTQEFKPRGLFRLLTLTTTPTLNDLRPVDLERLNALPEEDRLKELSQISVARLLWRDMTPEQLINALDYIPQEQHGVALQAYKGILYEAIDNPVFIAGITKKISRCGSRSRN